MAKGQKAKRRDSVRVLLVEDHKIVREGLRLLLDTDDGIDVVGEAQNGREAVALSAALRPDVIVMDIAMPDLNGLEATRQITKRQPAARVLILSAHHDDAYIDQSLESGACGFLIKQSSGHVLTKAIREAHEGRPYFSPTIARHLDKRNRNSVDRRVMIARKSPHLTSREIEVLQLVAEGRANKEVAAELGISIKTVEKHRQNLMTKLDIHDTAGLTRYAIASGVIESSVQITIL